MKKPYVIVAFVWLIAIVAALTSYWINIGYQEDKKTEEDLRTIQTQIGTYLNKNKRMPKSLSDLNIKNIEVNKYEYKYEGIDMKNDEYKYQLCAVYMKKSKSSKELGNDNYIGGYHTAGRYCYDLRQYTLNTYSDINSSVDEKTIEN